MRKKSRLHPDVVISIVALVFGALLLIEIHGYPDDVKMFPRLFLILFMIFMGITLVNGIRKTLAPEKYDASEWWARLDVTRNPILTAVMIVVYVALIGILGFYISTAIYMLVSMYVFGSKKWIVNLVVTASLLVFCFVLFEKLLSVTLPVGLLLKAILG